MDDDVPADPARAKRSQEAPPPIATKAAAKRIAPSRERSVPRGSTSPHARQAGATARDITAVFPSADAPAPLDVLRDADAELVEIYHRAQWIGGLGGEALVSFTSMFLAMLGGGNPVAEWVKTTADELALDPQKILEHWRGRAGRRFPPSLTVEHVRWPRTRAEPGEISPAATMMLDAARALQPKLHPTALGVRHLLATYLLTPPIHADDLEPWGLRRRSWLARFVLFVSHEYRDEAEHWRAVCLAEPPPITPRLASVVSAGQGLALSRGAAEVDVADLVRALLAQAAQWQGQELSCVWLLEQLARDARVRLGVPATLPVSSADVKLSPEVAAWSTTTQLYALCSEDGATALRHFIAALVSPRGPATGKQMLREAGGAPTKLARGLAELIRTTVPEEDHATWQAILHNDAAPRELRKPGYASDVARGVDLLSIEGDVRALAAVLASTDTEPPLSVGLFGSWGSGKSFFMGMLRNHIRALAEQSCGAKQTTYCSEIAQIEFNAWHYMDGDLWASLVCHVLDSLERHFRGDEKSLIEQRKQELAAAQLQRADVEKRQSELDKRGRELDEEIARHRPTAAQIASTLTNQFATTLRDTVEGDPQVREAIADVAKRLGVEPSTLDLAKIRARTKAWVAWWKQLSWRRIALGVAVLAVVALATVFAEKIASLTNEWIKPWMVAAISWLTPLIAITRQIIAVGRPIAASAKKAVELGDRVATELANASPDILAKRQALQAEQQQVTADLKALDKRAEDLRQQLDSVAKPGMREYVLQRSASADYRQRLGILASVHRDFQNLSDQLRDDKAPPKLQRIILYIDDLDRCSPERVVEVLQAIHLLLSFELFVVVVAVDPSWLMRSLEAYYARQFPNEGAPRPGDWESRPQFYLEKIFQIPYALRPMTASRFGAMVGGLLKTTVAGSMPSTPIEPAVASASQAITGHVTAAPAPFAPTAPRAIGALDLTPRSLEITKAELDHLRTLGPLVASPRAVKRLVNLYRIVRAGLDGDALEEFVDDRYQLTQIVLAAVVGCPNIAEAWFREILPRASGDLAALLAPLKAAATRDPRAQFLHDRINDSRESQSWDHAIAVCTSAARYSFETGPLLDLVRS